MSNDLISRKEAIATLEKVFNEYGVSWGKEWGGFAKAVPQAIENLPTAYDIDKVVEQLEERVKECERIVTSYREPSVRYFLEGLEEAIEIVKKGGAE